VWGFILCVIAPAESRFGGRIGIPSWWGSRFGPWICTTDNWDLGQLYERLVHVGSLETYIVASHNTTMYTIHLTNYVWWFLIFYYKKELTFEISNLMKVLYRLKCIELLPSGLACFVFFNFILDGSWLVDD
jgi:hypothetical protein